MSPQASTDAREAGQLREAMTDKLTADGWIASPVVEEAFRRVPRHLFVPDGTTLEHVYDAQRAVYTKQDEAGANMSSVSAPWLQAKMIAQAGIGPGMRVLEIGSGGYNAALLAEVTGEKGLVVTMDIDPEITGRASASLEAAGYGERVTVITADGEDGFPGHAPYDAIVATVGAWDIPAPWREQLAPGGTMVLPLRVNMITRSLAFRRDGDHWQGVSSEVCGFVPMQGIGARPEPVVRLPDPQGGHVELRFDQDAPDDAGLLAGALESGPSAWWSGVTIANGTSFADLHLWLASFLPGFCKVAASDGSALAALGVNRGWFPFGGAHGDSFSYLTLRDTGRPGDGQFEFGAGGYGPHADEAAKELITQIQEWDATARGPRGTELPGTAFAYWPAGTAIPESPTPVGVFPKRNGDTVTISWPAAG